MNINVTRTEVIVGNGYIVNKGEYKINPCVFTFSQEYTNLVKKAVFDDGKTTKEMAIINNRCELPYEVLDSDSFQLRVYAYRVNEQELELVYSPTPAIIYLREGSYRGVTGSGEIITPTQYEQYEQALNDGLDDLEAGLQEVSNVDIDVSKSGNTATVTITDRQGTEKSVEIFDGDDYVLTEEDKQEIINTVEAEVSLDIPTKVSQLENDSAYINKEVNNLTNYTLKTNTGSSIELSINSSTYVMTLNLKNSAGTTISTGTIDLPLETMVVGATYDNTNKKIVLTLKNGSTIDVPVADLISGLQSEITSSNKLSSDLVDDTNHTNKFVTTSEKEQITTNATDISNIKDGTSIDSFGDVETALSGKEDSSNKVTSIDENSTNTQYPSAKVVYDELVERDEEIEELQTENAQLLADHPDITDTGTDLTLNGTGDLKMSVDVGGNSTQIQYEGYNLYQPTLDNISKVNCTVTLNEDEFVFVATGTDMRIGTVSGIGEDYYIGNGQKIDVIGKSNLSILLTNTDFNSIFFNAFDSNDVSLGYTGINSYKGSHSIPVNASYVTVRLGKNNAVSGTIYKTKVMVYEGSTEKPYEPFVGNQASPNPTYKQDINNVEGDVEVKGSSKNLFDSDELLVNSVYNDNFITNEKSNFYGILEISKLTFPLTISTDIILNDKNYNDTSLRLNILDDSMNYITRIYGSNSTTSNSKSVIILTENKIPANAVYIKLNIRLNSAGYTENSQIELGTQATSYVPHAENSVTFPLSQGQKLMLGDTLEDDGIHHKRGKIILDGTETTLSFKSDSNAPFILTINDIKPSTSNDKIPNIKSSHFIPVTWNTSFVNYDSLIAISITLPNIINFRYKDISTLEEFKTWLAQQYANNTPVIVEYELETETIDQYTPEQQTAYNKLKEMQSYYDLTYVVGSSDNAQPILTVQAKKSLKVMQDEIDEIKQAILNS